ELVFGLHQAFGAHRGFREDRLLVAPRLRGKLLRRRLDLGRNRRDAQTRIPGAGNFEHSSRTSPATFSWSPASAGALTTRSIHAAICFISGSFMPRLVTLGVPSRIPDGSNGLRGSNGTVL